MKGQYVRMLIAPRTRNGTITDTRVEHGRVEYLFHHDPRFDDRTPDFWLSESEVEPCNPPTDAEVAAINALAKYGTT
jgi:hypothetical protein